MRYRQFNRLHQAEYRARCLAAGVCKECGAPALISRLRCAQCIEEHRKRRAELRDARRAAWSTAFCGT